MDRIINVKVGGNYLSKDNKNAGVRGEANVTKLRIAFDEGWEGYTKKVTFWDARGLNPVVIDLLPHLCEGGSTYIVPIPAEPMTEAGQFTFVIEGTVDNKVQRSFSDKLEVKDAPVATNAGQPVPPTKDELTQVQEEIEAIKGDILRAEAGANTAEINAQIAIDMTNRANQWATEAERSAGESKGYADDAIAALTKAESTISRYPFIGGDGYWYVWNADEQMFEKTNVKAQAGSTVYMGDNPPDDADVWIDPKGESVVPTPQRGVDYWTEEDKAEIKAYVEQAILGGEW